MKLKIILLIFFICINNLYPKPLKLVWWNVKDLFDTVNDPDKDDKILTNAEYSTKIKLITKKLIDFNADIVGLAEVENINILKELSELSGYKFYYLIEGNDPRGIDICMLCKWQVTYISHKEEPTPYKENKAYRFSRDCPEACFDFDGNKIYLLLNHLKSMADDNKKNKDKSVKKRVAQAKGILDIILGIYKKNSSIPNILLMGDFNSKRNSEPLNILQKSGLKIINYDYREDSIYTIDYNNIKEDIDYFIFNEELYKKVKIKKFVSIHNNDIEKISDHFPLYIELDL